MKPDDVSRKVNQRVPAAAVAGRHVHAVNSRHSSRHRGASDLLDRGQETSDPAARRAIYAEFQKILAEEVPTIMMFSSDVLTANRTRLKNYVQHGTGWYFGLVKAWVEG